MRVQAGRGFRTGGIAAWVVAERVVAGSLLAALLAGCAVQGSGSGGPAGASRVGAVATAAKAPGGAAGEVAAGGAAKAGMANGGGGGLPVGGADPNSPDALTPDDMQRFLNVVARVEPLAEAYCRRFGQNPGGARNCNIGIAVDTNPYLGPNAFQTLDGAGRPVVVFTLALIARTRNEDELAFVMGHEAGHHIAGHIPARERSALRGAMVAGVLAAAAGSGAAEVQQAQQRGAEVAARRFSKEFELEADRIGTQIAFASGYDPLLGAQFFGRLPDPGDQFLGSHPANADRQAAIAQTMAGLTGG